MQKRILRRHQRQRRSRTIISWALLSLLNNIYLVTKIHVFMYLKDIIRGENKMKIEGNEKEIAAMKEFHKGNRSEGLKLQEESVR